MIKRIVEISREPVHLAVKLDQLLIQRHDPDPGTIGSIPCEDIGVVVVDHPQATYSHHALGRLAEFGAVVVICGRDHMPAGVLLPMATHTEVVWRIQDQVNVSKPVKKRLWKQLVIAKVQAQAANLRDPAKRRLVRLAAEVRSGDPMNVEAQAAKIYWSAWLGEGRSFRRDPDGDGINGLLNYGYAVLRAAVGRALVSGGLLPAIGIHHSNRSNAFCLADDLIEPLRPMIDALVRQLVQRERVKLDRDAKAVLLGALHRTVRLGDQQGPLMVGLHRYAASLSRCFRGEEKNLLIPHAVEDDG